MNAFRSWLILILILLMVSWEREGFAQTGRFQETLNGFLQDFNPSNQNNSRNDRSNPNLDRMADEESGNGCGQASDKKVYPFGSVNIPQPFSSVPDDNDPFKKGQFKPFPLQEMTAAGNNQNNHDDQALLNPLPDSSINMYGQKIFKNQGITTEIVKTLSSNETINRYGQIMRKSSFFFGTVYVPQPFYPDGHYSNLYEKPRFRPFPIPRFGLIPQQYDIVQKWKNRSDRRMPGILSIGPNPFALYFYNKYMNQQRSAPAAPGSPIEQSKPSIPTPQPPPLLDTPNPSPLEPFWKNPERPLGSELREYLGNYGNRYGYGVNLIPPVSEEFYLPIPGIDFNPADEETTPKLPVLKSEPEVPNIEPETAIDISIAQPPDQTSAKFPAVNESTVQKAIFIPKSKSPTELLFDRALETFIAKDYSKALEQFEQLKAFTSDDANVLIGCGLALLTKGSYKESAEALRKGFDLAESQNRAIDSLTRFFPNDSVYDYHLKRLEQHLKENSYNSEATSLLILLSTYHGLSVQPQTSY